MTIKTRENVQTKWRVQNKRHQNDPKITPKGQFVVGLSMGCRSFGSLSVGCKSIPHYIRRQKAGIPIQRRGMPPCFCFLLPQLPSRSISVVAEVELVHCAEERVEKTTMKSMATCFPRQRDVRISAGRSHKSGSGRSGKTGMPAVQKMSATVSRRQLWPRVMNRNVST